MFLVILLDDLQRVGVAEHDLGQRHRSRLTGGDALAGGLHHTFVKRVPLVRPSHRAHPALPLVHSHGGDQHLHALIEGRHPDGVRPAEARAENADSLRVHAPDRLHVGDGVVGVLRLLQGPLAAALALALAEAAMIRRQDEVALLPEPPGNVHPVDLLQPAVAVQADDGGPGRVALSPAFRRIEVGCDFKTITVVNNFFVHAGFPSRQRRWAPDLRKFNKNAPPAYTTPAVRLSFAMQTLQFAQQFSGVGRAHERLPDEDGVHPLIHQGSHFAPPENPAL